MNVLAAVLPLSSLAQCITPPGGLVAWWRAEGNTLDTAGTNAGVLVNGATFTTGLLGQAFTFNGINSYVNVPDSPALRLGSEVSVEFWVKRQRFDAVDYIVEKGGDWTGTEANYAVALHTSSANYCLHFVFAGGWRGGGRIADLNWHHCAVVARHGDANPTFYIDGVPQPVTYSQGVSAINLYPSTRPLHIGALLDPVRGWYYYSKTTIDELSIFNRQLSGAEVYALYAAGAAGKCPPSTAPLIVVQPTNQAVAVGAPAAFAVSATGSAPLNYQWLFHDEPLSEEGPITGSTNALLSFSAARTNDAGSYRVVVSNAFGTATSAVANLIVGFPPVITAPPQDQAVPLGGNVTFTVAATGTEPLTCRWRFNGGSLPTDSRFSGADTATLSISNLASADAGSYSVLVSNFAGSVVSAPALLTVVVAPAFVSQPLGRSVPLGLPASFSASVSGTAPLSWQWQLDGLDIPGATNSTLDIPAVTTADFGLYRLMVSNSAGAAFSELAPLTCGPVAAWGENSYGQTLVPPGLSNVVAIDASDFHSLALRADGTVAAWGNNDYGQTNVPADLANVISIAAGTYHSLALRADGTVVVWGDNSYSKTNVPAGLSNVVAVAAGNHHCLALRADGSVAAWGNNAFSMINGAVSLYDIVAIASGDSHGLALRADGTVVGWGYNGYGQTNVPPGLSNVVAIAAGARHNLALRADGTVVGWGYNAYGQATVPEVLTNAIAVAAGDFHSLVLRADGTIASWGLNNYGQTNLFPGLSNVVAVSTRASFNLALLHEGPPLLTRQPPALSSCTGRSLALRAAAVGSAPLNFQWQKDGLDIPGATNATLLLPALALSDQGTYQLLVTNSLGAVASLPVPVTVLDEVAPYFLSRLPWSQTNYLGSSVALGFSIGGSGPLHYQWRLNGRDIPGASREELVFDPILLTNAGTYSLFVSNRFGAVTSASDTLSILQLKAWGYMPTDPPASASNVVAVSVGASSYLALRADGKVVAWGSGLGAAPVPASLSNVVAVSAGYDHSMALRADGSVFVWGSNYYGQSNVPPTASSVVAIAAGYSHDLALRADGTVVAWGYNTSRQATVPTNLASVVAIAAGSSHSLALQADGTVVGWGNSAAYLPMPPTLTNAIAIAAGAYHSLALRADGTVVGWGQSDSGAAIIPPGLSNVVAVAAGAYHSAALRADGTIVTWGSSSAAVPLSDMTSAIQIASGGEHALTLFGNRSPAVTVQPFSRTLFRGSNTVFVAKAAGAPPLSYQWRFKGADISGATTDSLVLTNLQFSQAGAYQLLVSNAYGVASTVKAKLAVTLPLAQALDTTSLTWTTSGNAPWFGQAEITSDGNDAARSGAINNGQESVLQTSVAGPGRLFWYWKVSSEATFDKLEFRLNGLAQAAISGSVDWQQCSFGIPAGTQAVQWAYTKDVSLSDGLDAGWVDQVSFVSAPRILYQPATQTVPMGGQVSLSVVASGAPFSFQWFHDGAQVAGATDSTLRVPNAARRDNGAYFVLVSNPGGTIPSSNAFVKVLVPQQLGAPILQPDGSLTLTAGDADGGLLTAADLANFEAQVSTNLVLWEPLPGSLTLSNGLLQLQDTNAPGYPLRFYRIYER